MKAKDKDFWVKRKFVQSTTFLIAPFHAGCANERPCAETFRSPIQVRHSISPKDFFLFSFDV
jgi:hypothetical protein